MINSSSTYLLFVFLIFNSAELFAQEIVESGEQSAGFSFSATSDAIEPIVHYQQNIQMLSAMTDKASLSVFGDGRVLVHYPAYMKKAGDYEMRLDTAELKQLLHTLSNNGVLDFDEKKVKAKVATDRKSLTEKGQFYAISDAAITVVDIKLDSYQKNKKSNKKINFHKQFKWKNIKHDADRYKNNKDITRANNSVKQLKGLMNDTRLVGKKQR